jgi:hypothetical protein
MIAPFRLIYMPRPEHAVHRVGEALFALVTVRIVCGVHTAEAKAVETGPVFYGRCVCCHHAHLQIKTTQSPVIRPREAVISWKSVTRSVCHTTGCVDSSISTDASGWLRLTD